MENDKEQQLAKRKLKKNFFREAVLQEIKLFKRKQRFKNAKKRIIRKKLSPNPKIAM